jgi:predicted MPP superfamily phosphohydrolase
VTRANAKTGDQRHTSATVAGHNGFVRRKAVLAAVLGVPLLLALWAFALEPASLEVNRCELALPRWPAEQDGLLVALLSDLHVGSPFNGVDKLEEIVSFVNRSRPHVVLLAGDYVVTGVPGGEFVPPETTAGVLTKLEAPLGVFAVLGNHDHWYDGPRVQAALESAGIRVLENESLRLQGEGFDFWIVGIGDLWEVKPDVASILESLPADAAAIAFTHNPDIFPRVTDRVALTLAGHTHGGQVDFPLWGAPVVPSRFGERYARGHVVEDGRHLFVTSGLGTSILPVRFRVPPEIALLRIGSGLKSLPPVELGAWGSWRSPGREPYRAPLPPTPRPARSSPG